MKKITDYTISDSRTTLVPKSMKPAESKRDDAFVENSSNLNKSSQVEDETVTTQNEGKWKRFKKHFQ